MKTALKEYTIAEILEQQASGALTCRALTEAYLERIAAMDQAGPRLNSIIEINPQALEIAEQLDAERAAGQTSGPLHGVPLVLKDNIDTADQLCTTAGSLALDGWHARQDAGLVSRLRAAGALILAKANLSEWANFRSKRSVSGWSSRGGQTRNPYALDRSPCGSSSGSAVAVAANLCAAAIGTETDGSIVCPSQTNGIAGLKPTLGLISRAGIIPIAHSQDTAGPMARSVADLAVLLGVLAGPDERDPASLLSAGHTYSDYTQFLDPQGLENARLGVARNYFGLHPEVDALAEAAIQQMRTLGAEIVDPAPVETEGRWSAAELQVLLYEFKADLNAYLRNLLPEAPVHSMQEVIDFNLAHPEQTMPFFGQERMLQAIRKGPLSSPRYLQALARGQRLARADGIDAALFKHNLDALVAPTGGPAWLVDPISGDTPAFPGTSSAPAVAGYPHLTVPMGYVRGLPVGLSFICSAWQEPRLLRLAYAYEQASQARRPPAFPPSIVI